MSQFWENRDGRTDRRIDRPYFTGPFWPRPWVRFEQLLLYNPLSGCFCYMAIMCGQIGARYVKSHTLSVWHMHCSNNTHKKILKKFHMHFHIFANMFLKNLVLKFFLKTCFLWFEMIISSMNLFPFKNVIWYFTAPWCWLNYWFSLNLIKQK